MHVTERVVLLKCNKENNATFMSQKDDVKRIITGRVVSHACNLHVTGRLLVYEWNIESSVTCM